MPALQRVKNTTNMLNYFIKFSVSAALLFMIFNNVDLEQAYASASMLSLGTVLMALVLQIASNSIASFRWFLIMQRLGSTKNFLFFLLSYFKGTFFNQGLPTSIGGDAIRILDCSRNSHSKLDGFYGVFIDRFVGLAGLLILNIVALLFNRNILPQNIYFALLAILALLFFALITLLFVYRFRLFRTNKWFAYIGQLSERYYQVYASPSSLAVQIGLSVIIHLLAMTAFYVLGIGVGLDYPLSVYLVLVPPVVLLIILPISLAGWGIREGAMISIFLLVGADRSKVLTFSLLYGLLALTSSLPGLFVYLIQKNRL